MSELIDVQPVLGGTDGFRGKFTQEMGPGKVNAETFTGLTAALMMQPETTGRGPVVIAQDTRPSSTELREDVLIGVQFGSAADIIDLGVNPTPMAQKVAQDQGARATVVVTASHNPAQENGWKGMIGHSKPNDAQVKAISSTYYDNLKNPQFGLASEVISMASRQEHIDWYHDKVVDKISTEFGEGVLTDKLFVYDGAQGAARELAPRILRSLGAEVIEFACDGLWPINDGCGAADLSGVESFLRANKKIRTDPRFVGALANDGDGDRVMGVAVVPTVRTRLKRLDGNHMMWALAEGEDGLVGTLYTNTGLRQALAKSGVEFEEVGNGDRYVTEALRRRQSAGGRWRRGGEFTGHLIDTDWLDSGDGLLQGAWYAADTVSRGMTFADRTEELELWPEMMQTINMPRHITQPYVDSEAFQQQQQEWQDQLGDDGRLVIRASGTEDKLRIWGEANKSHDIGRFTMLAMRKIARDLEAA